MTHSAPETHYIRWGAFSSSLSARLIPRTATLPSTAGVSNRLRISCSRACLCPHYCNNLSTEAFATRSLYEKMAPDIPISTLVPEIRHNESSNEEFLCRL